MSNSIWHKYDIKDMPSLTREILARNGSHHNVCIINREDWEQGFCEWIDRWTYITDIVAQADKAERLQKAVDYVLDSLQSFMETGYIYTDVDDVILDIQATCNEIKQLIKGE